MDLSPYLTAADVDMFLAFVAFCKTPNPIKLKLEKFSNLTKLETFIEQRLCLDDFRTEFQWLTTLI